MVSIVQILLSKNEMHWCHAYCCLLHSCCLVLSHNALYSWLEREYVAWQNQIVVSIEPTLTTVPLTERISKLLVLTVSPLKHITPHTYNFTIKSKLKLCCICKWRYTEQGNRIIFLRGLLDWLLPIWTFPLECETCDKRVFSVVLDNVVRISD